jgi:hypothetical protein
MNKIDRNEAITLICNKKLSYLDKGQRASYILNWWGIDKEDIKFVMLSSRLQHLILENEEPPDDIEHDKYNELILIALFAEFKGVTNTFIEKTIEELELENYQVHGEVERLETCPCCKYRTLDSRGNYDICGLCHWEDDGVEDGGQYSGPNHMTLGEGRKQFKKYKNTLNLEKWVKNAYI